MCIGNVMVIRDIIEEYLVILWEKGYAKRLWNKETQEFEYAITEQGLEAVEYIKCIEGDRVWRKKKSSQK